MPYTQEQYQRAKSALSSGAIPQDKVGVVQQRLADFESDQARGYLRAPEEAPVAKVNSPSTKASRELGIDIDLTRPDAIVLQAGETPGSIRLQKLKEQLMDKGKPNESKLRVFSDPPEYTPPAKPPNPFSPMSPFSFGMENAGHSKYFHEATVDEFRQDVAKSPALQKRLSADFPAVSNALAVEDNNQLEASETFRAYRDAKWKMAYADAVKRGAPLYRVKYTTKLSPAEKEAALAMDAGDAAIGGAGQAMSLGLLDPLKHAVNPELNREDRAARMRNPGFELAGEVGGSIIGLPRMLYKGASKIVGKLGIDKLGKYPAVAASGALTSAADDSARQVGESVAESLDAHDAALEALARLQDRFSLARTGVSALAGAGAGVVGQGVADAADALGRKILTHPSRVGAINENLETGGMMDRKGDIVIEPDLEAGRSLAARNGTNLETKVSGQLADDVLKGQRLAQEGLNRQIAAESAAMEGKLKTVGSHGGSIGMGEQRVPVSKALSQIGEAINDIPEYTAGDQSAKKALSSFASKLSQKGEAGMTLGELDKAIASADTAANAAGGKPNPHFQRVSRILRDVRDQFNVPEYAAGSSFDDAASKANEVAAKNGSLPEVQRFLNETRRAVSEGERAGAGGKTSDEVTRFLRDAQAQGATYDGPTYRGTSPAELESIRSGKTGHTMSVSADADGARNFARKGGVLLEVEGGAVPVDGIDGSNTYREALIPKGSQVSIVGERVEDGVRVVKVRIGRPKAIVRDSRGGEKMVGDYSTMKASQEARLRGLSDQNEALGIPEPDKPIPVASRMTDATAEVTDSPAGGVFDPMYGSTPERWGVGKPTTKTVAVATEGDPNVAVSPNTREAVAGRIRNAAPASSQAAGRDLVVQAIENRGENAKKLFDTLRRAKARGDYEAMLGDVVNGLSVGPHGMGNKFLNRNNLLRLVPTLKGIAGARPTPPRFEPTPTLKAAIDEIIAAPGKGGATVAAENARSGVEIMDKFVPELGGGLLNIGDGRLPAVASKVGKKRESALSKLSPEEQQVLAVILSNMAKMTPEAP